MAKYYQVPVKAAGDYYSPKTKSIVTLVERELLTKKEAEKKGLNLDKLIPVEVSSSRICWFFGARFAPEEAKIYHQIEM